MNQRKLHLMKSKRVNATKRHYFLDEAGKRKSRIEPTTLDYCMAVDISRKYDYSKQTGSSRMKRHLEAVKEFGG